MNTAQALSKLRKFMGSRLAYRLDKDAPSSEQREAIRAAWADARAKADAAVAARKARYEHVLKNDAEYQRLRVEAAAAEAAAQKAGAGMLRHRITVGIDTGMFFSIEAEGDNWDDVVAKVESKRAAR